MECDHCHAGQPGIRCHPTCEYDGPVKRRCQEIAGGGAGRHFFCISMEMALPPAIGGSAANALCIRKRAAALPEGLEPVEDISTVTDPVPPRVLLSQPARTSLEEIFKIMSGASQVLFQQTIPPSVFRWNPV